MANSEQYTIVHVNTSDHRWHSINISAAHHKTFLATSLEQGIRLFKQHCIHLAIIHENAISNKKEFLLNLFRRYPNTSFLLLLNKLSNEYTSGIMDNASVFCYSNDAQGVLFSKTLSNLIEAHQLKRENKKLITDISDKSVELHEKSRILAILKEANLRSRLKNINEISSLNKLVGKSQALQSIINRIKLVAPTNTSVLIQGETGVGKELIADLLHQMSLRSGKPFIKINCATLLPQLMESELFGHEKGSFTGAAEKKIGKFEIANGGTIFLDEIGELPLSLQPKLLRILQEGEYNRVGSVITRSSNVRIIAATNRDLENEMMRKKFREDLYFRLCVFPIHIPPLRERPDDIPPLANYFIDKYSKKLGKKFISLPYEETVKLLNYSWPGNIRELENLVERSLILSSNGSIHFEIIQGRVNNSPIKEKEKITRSWQEIECHYILTTLHISGWKITGKNSASEMLKLNPSTLRSKMRRLGIKRKTSSVH